MDVNKLKKYLVIFYIMGSTYFNMEGLWNGKANFIMFFIGSVIGLVIDALNQNDKYYFLPVWLQSCFGLIFIWFVEFVAGCYFNLGILYGLHLNLWNYSNVGLTIFNHYIPLNLMGQICLPYGALFFLIVPLCTWLGDFIRYTLFGEKDRKYGVKEIYVELFTGK